VSDGQETTPAPDRALERLLAGNAQYVGGRARQPRQSPTRREEVCGSQTPFAVVLGCSDSRVPPEIIFDQGLGDLFVLRVAGNVVDDIVLGSIEYAAVHLDVTLVMVLGHNQCGAVTATALGDGLEGHLPSLARAIQPAVDKASEMKGDLLDNAVKLHASKMASQLRESQPVLAPLVESGKLTVVAAHYDMESGVVKVL
jgi:carbonic anhydrase